MGKKHSPVKFRYDGPSSRLPEAVRNVGRKQVIAQPLQPSHGTRSPAAAVVQPHHSRAPAASRGCATGAFVASSGCRRGGVSSAHAPHSGTHHCPLSSPSSHTSCDPSSFCRERSTLTAASSSPPRPPPSVSAPCCFALHPPPSPALLATPSPPNHPASHPSLLDRP